jgi:hypothetical protein
MKCPPHLSDDELIRYFDHRLEPVEAGRVSERIQGCVSCGQKAQVYRLIRDSVAPSPVSSAIPPLAAVLQEAQRANTNPSSNRNRAVNVMGFLARPVWAARFGWNGISGLAAALALGALAGLWVSDRKADVTAPIAVPSPVTTTSENSPPSPEIKKLIQPPVPPDALPNGISLGLRGNSPERENRTQGITIWPTPAQPAAIGASLEALRWSADIQGVYLDQALIAFFQNRPEVKALYKQWQAKRTPSDSQRTASLKSGQKFTMTNEQLGFRIDPRIQRAYIFHFTARRETVPQFLEKLAQSSQYCWVRRNNAGQFIRHAGIRVDQRDGVYYFAPSD